MNYFKKIPQPDRFWAALLFLPLAYLLVKGIMEGMVWALNHGHHDLMLTIGAVGLLASWQLQRISAYTLYSIKFVWRMAIN